MIVVPHLSRLELEEAATAGNICFPRLQLQLWQSGYCLPHITVATLPTCLYPMPFSLAPQQSLPRVTPGTLSSQVCGLWTPLLIFELYDIMQNCVLQDGPSLPILN